MGPHCTQQYGSFSLPAFVHPLIDMVIGISNFPQYQPNRLHTKPRVSTLRLPSSLQANNIGVVPQSCYGMYNIPTQTQQNASKITSQGVIEWEGQFFAPSELQKFANLVEIPITPLTADHIVGKNSGPGKIEASLDIQYMSSVNVEAMNWFWIEDGNGWLYGFTTHFYNTATVPQVISISYGWWEGAQCAVAGDECTILKVKDDAYVARINTEFQKIALRGTTIVVSSGDDGAHTPSDKECRAKTLYAEFPAASPYVTSVGATQLTTSTPLNPQPTICKRALLTCAQSGTEEAVSYDGAGYTSGGGFSEVAAMPDYQTAAVGTYLSSGVQLPPASMYNTSNRAHPDVASIGNNIIIYNGGVASVGGTSASAPIFAAVVSLLNQASIAKSGQPLGFLNPLLYKIFADNPSAFNDITVGDNICTESGCAKSCKGWYATKGWDPVTGLGTPNYSVLLQEVIKLGENPGHC